MPRFDFLCTDCKSTFEHLLSPGAPPPPCIACGSTKVEKRLSAPGVIFKGAGFYKTDAGSKKTRPKDGQTAASAKAETPGEAKKGGETAKKTETAPQTPSKHPPS